MLVAARAAEELWRQVDGALHVELELAADAASRIPVQHGLTASVAVEVERVSPAALVLRAAGKLVDREPPPDR